MGLKALAEGVLRRDTERDSGRDTPCRSVSTDLLEEVQSETVSEAARIYSRLLDAELCVVSDDDTGNDLHREGVTLPVLLPTEAKILARMAEADARELFAAFGRIQHAMPGAQLREVTGGLYSEPWENFTRAVPGYLNSGTVDHENQSLNRERTSNVRTRRR